MSEVPHETINIRDAGIENQASHGAPDSVDGSGPIFSMYLERAEEEDKKLVESWKADADGILIFVGLFSATVASFISVSIQDIRPNPQDISNFYLANIYQTVSDPNRFNISSSLLASPPAFSPPTYAVWVNALWFMSLAIGLACAILATFLQQWARRYLKATQPRYSLHKRARIRAFIAERVGMFLQSWVVHALPMLLQLSLSLFGVGMFVLLLNVNLTVFKLVLPMGCLSTFGYACITFIPIVYPEIPCYTPFTSLVWLIPGTPSVTILAQRLLRRYDYFSEAYRGRSEDMEERQSRSLSQHVRKTTEAIALNSSSKIDRDVRAFIWTFDSLDKDHELERFFSGLPGFRNSKVVDDPLPSLTSVQKGKLSTALIGLFDRTFSSDDSLPEPDKNRRAIICAKALDPAELPYAYWYILRAVMSKDQYRGLQTAEFIRAMRGWGGGGDRESALIGQAIFTSLVARAQRHDDSWLLAAPNELGIPEADLRDYAAHGDNLSLASLILITRHQISHNRKSSWPTLGFSTVLGEASEFNVQNTSPELQHEFCALWNQIVLKAQNNDDWTIARFILTPIRNIYIDLHQETDAAPTQFSTSTSDCDVILRYPSSYPVCNVAGHIHDDSVPTTFARTVLHDNAALVPASLASPEAPSSSVPAPLRVDESLTIVPPLDNFHPAHQKTIESLRIPVTSPDLATAGAIPVIVTSSITIPHPTSETSTSALPSSSPLAAVALQHNPDLLTPSDPANLPPSAPSTPALDNILPTESHCSIIVTTAPSASPGPTSAPVSKNDGSLKPGLGKDKDALDPPSVNCAIHANAMATQDPPP